MSSSGQNNQGSSSSKGKGRQKVDLKKMENGNNREVTFSKRKGGLLKKASELSTLSGAEVVVVVFSPSGKPYSFGHPNLYATTNKFIGRDVFPTTGGGQSSGAAQRHMNVNQEELDQLCQLESMVESEKKIGKELDHVRDQASQQLDFSKLDYDQLEMCLDIVQNFQNYIQAAKKGLNVNDKRREPLQNKVLTSPKANAPPPLAHHGSGSSSGFVAGPPPHSSNLPANLHDPSVGRSNFNVVPYGLGGHIGWNHSDVATGGTEVFASPKANAMVLPHGSGSSSGFWGGPLAHGSGSFSSFGGGPLAPGSGSSSSFGGGPPHRALASPNDPWAGWLAAPYGSGGHVGWGINFGPSGSNVDGSGTSNGVGDGSATTSNHVKF